MMLYDTHSSDTRTRAKAMLGYYFRLIAERAGVNWDSDNDAEIERALDELVEAADAVIACRNSEHCADHGTTMFAGCLGCDCAAAARQHRASHQISEAKPSPSTGKAKN